MLKVDVKINCERIGHVGIANTTVTNDAGDTKYEVIDIVNVDPYDTESIIASRLGYVWHDRDEGADALISTVLDEYGDVLLDDEP